PHREPRNANGGGGSWSSPMCGAPRRIRSALPDAWDRPQWCAMRTELPRILATRCDVLSPRMVHVIEELAGDWHRLDERIKGESSEIEALGDQDPACERLMTVPGIGPIILSAPVTRRDIHRQ